MIFFPAIDIIDGKCVRLSQGDFNRQSRYQYDPAELAKSWEAEGATHLHLVDLDGAKSGSVKNLSVLEKISAATNLQIDFGGGLSTRDLIFSAFEAGARKVNLGSLAVRQPELFNELLEKIPDQIILSMDIKDGLVAFSGWQQQSVLSATDLLSRHNKLKYVSVTDISKDGTLEGPNFELYQDLTQNFKSVNFIASGGVSSVPDLKRLRDIGLYGCIAGKAILEGRFSVQQVIREVTC